MDQALPGVEISFTWYMGATSNNAALTPWFLQCTINARYIPLRLPRALDESSGTHRMVQYEQQKKSEQKIHLKGHRWLPADSGGGKESKQKKKNGAWVADEP